MIEELRRVFSAAAGSLPTTEPRAVHRLAGTPLRSSKWPRRIDAMVGTPLRTAFRPHTEAFGEISVRDELRLRVFFCQLRMRAMPEPDQCRRCAAPVVLFLAGPLAFVETARRVRGATFDHVLRSIGLEQPDLQTSATFISTRIPRILAVRLEGVCVGFTGPSPPI